jgi:hypothetical protein
VLQFSHLAMCCEFVLFVGCCRSFVFCIFTVPQFCQSVSVRSTAQRGSEDYIPKIVTVTMSWTRHGADHCPWVGVWQFFLQLEPLVPHFRLAWNQPDSWSAPERKCVLDHYRDTDASIAALEGNDTFEITIEDEYCTAVANHEGGLEKYGRQCETEYVRHLSEIPGRWTKLGLSPFADNAPLFKQHRLHETPEAFSNSHELFCYVIEAEGWFIKRTIVTPSTITSSV